MPAKENGVSNNRGVYVGVFLEIRVRQHATVSSLKRCADGHEAYSGRYCQHCGQPLEPVTELVYPTMIEDLLPRGSSLVDDLAEVTPAAMFGGEAILAIGNDSQRFNGEWFQFDFRDDAPAWKPLPTEIQTGGMIADFLSDYNDVISALWASPLAYSVSALFGIVPLEEY